MRRRQYLGTLAGSTLLVAGCLGNFADEDRDENEVFADYWYETDELVVEFRDGVDVETARLLSDESQEHERVEGPVGTARFPVVFPNRLDTHLTSRSPLRVEAQTANGTARMSVWEQIHGVVRDLEPDLEGRAQLRIENQGTAPLLIRFVSVHGDVPEPAADPTNETVELDSHHTGPGVVGTGENHAQQPERSDLVVPGEAERSFETSYRPFGDDGAVTDEERSGTVSLVQASGGINSYSFSY